MEPSDHSLQTHIDKLDRLCRICGGRSIQGKDPRKPALKCKQYSSKIETVYGINVCKDTVGVHSGSICNKCYARMNTLVAAGKSASEKTLQSAKDAIASSSDMWVPFDASASIAECHVCNVYMRQAKGGRPLKPQSNTPSQTPSTSVTNQNNDNQAPVSDLCRSSTPQSTPVVKRATKSPRATKRKTTANCKANKSGTSEQTIRTAKEIALPFTKAEKDLFAEMVRLTQKQSHDGETVVVRTGGKPITLKRHVKAQKSSQEAKTPTKNKRARAVNKFRKGVSGTSDGDIVMQIQKEIKKVGKTVARKLYENTRIGTPRLTAKETVRIQNMCENSNTKHKQFRAILRKKGFLLCTEEEEKQFKRDAQCGNYVVEQTAVFFYSKEADPVRKQVPVVKAEDLTAFVTNLLNKLKSKVFAMIKLTTFRNISITGSFLVVVNTVRNNNPRTTHHITQHSRTNTGYTWPLQKQATCLVERGTYQYVFD